MDVILDLRRDGCEERHVTEGNVEIDSMIEGELPLDLDPFLFEGGDVGCLLIHGGTGSPSEMRGMGEYLARKGLTVIGVRLAGHGTSPEDLATKDWKDFIASAEEGLDQIRSLCDKVFVAGLSFGGLITLYLAAHYPFQGAIVMSAPAYIHDWRLHLLPVLKYLVKWVRMGEESDLTDPEAHRRFFSYRRVPTVFGVQFDKLLRETKKSLPRVDLPLLLMQGTHDRTIPEESAQYFFDHVGSVDKEIVWFPNSGHAITIDRERELVWKKAYEFIIEHSSSEVA
jgi:carboxylesterase